MKTIFNSSVLLAALVGLSLLSRPAHAVTWGVNLAGAEFADYNRLPGTYGTDYAYPNDEAAAPNGSESAYYASKNLKLIRLPFRWERMQNGLFGPLFDSEVNHMRSFLAEARANGFKVIPDCHNYARFYEQNADPSSRTEYIVGVNLDKSALGNMWSKLIPRLSDYSDVIYGWDIMNEPRNMGPNGGSEDDQGKQAWFDVAQSTITAIRGVDMSKPIFIAGYQFSPTDRWTQYSDRLKNLSDPSNNLIYEGHTYWDADRSGTYNGGYDFQSQTGGDVNRSVSAISDFVGWLRSNGKKGFIGEFSVPSIAGGWQTELSTFVTSVNANDADVIVGGTYWAGGARWFSLNDSQSPVLDALHNYGDSNIANWTDKINMTTYLGAISSTGGGGSASSDAVSNVSGPTTVSPGQNISVSVNYSATTARKLEVGLKNPGANWAWYGGNTVNLSAGSGKASVSFTVASNAANASGCLYDARLLDTSNNQIGDAQQSNITVSTGNVPSTDGLSNVSGPTTVSPSQTISVSVNYSATTTRNIEIALKNPYYNYQWLGGNTVPVQPGSGTATVSFTVDPNAPLGNGFLYTARLNDTSNNLIQEITQTNISISQCLSATYFARPDLSSPKLTRLDKTVNFSWGTGAPVSGLPPTNYSVRWTGFLKPSATKTTTIYIKTDGGVRLSIGGNKIIDKWTNRTATEFSANVALTAGQKVPIVLEYTHISGSAVEQLSWSYSGLTKQIIPDSNTTPY